MPLALQQQQKGNNFGGFILSPLWVTEFPPRRGHIIFYEVLTHITIGFMATIEEGVVLWIWNFSVHLKNWGNPFPPAVCDLGWSFLGFRNFAFFCHMVSKLWIWFLRGWGRCLKVTLQTCAQKDFCLCRWGTEVHAANRISTWMMADFLVWEETHDKCSKLSKMARNKIRKGK